MLVSQYNREILRLQYSTVLHFCPVNAICIITADCCRRLDTPGSQLEACLAILPFETVVLDGFAPTMMNAAFPAISTFAAAALGGKQGEDTTEDRLERMAESGIDNVLSKELREDEERAAEDPKVHLDGSIGGIN